MNYELDLTIQPEDLANLRDAGLNISIAKPVGSQSPNVAWIAFDPFEANSVQWEEQYGVYASASQSLSDGTTIAKISDVFPANDNTNYTFDQSATFQKADASSGSPGTGVFGVQNQMPYSNYPILTFGLEQQAVVQGNIIDPTPINAALLPANFDATFEPIVTVYIWLEADIESGSVITDVKDNSTMVQFEGSTTIQSLEFDPNSGKFVLC